MFRAFRELVGCRVAGSDGDWGRVSDIYFNDLSWKVEFIVATLGRGRNARKVVLPVEALGGVDTERRTVNTRWNQEQLDSALPASCVLPVSKQYELLTPGALSRASGLRTSPYLRSYLAMRGYAAVSNKQYRGELADMTLNDFDWSIRSLQIQFPVQKKLVQFHLDPASVERVSCAARTINLKQFEPIQVEDETLVRFPALAASEASFA